jgi:sulfonate transport system ATP-binding protein
LLMDEPFSALDAITRARLSQDLLRLVEERHMSVLLVTHDLEEALALSDMVYLLSRGPKARIAGQYPVPIPRPRDIIKARTHPEFGPLLERIWQNLSREVVGEPGKDDQWAGFSIGL